MDREVVSGVAVPVLVAILIPPNVVVRWVP
jgi:hypothetical protein